MAHFIPKMQVCDPNVAKKIFITSAHYLPIKSCLTVKCVKKTLLYTLNNWLPGDHAIFSFHLIEIWPDHVQRTTMEAAKIWLDVTLERKCESCLNLALSGYGRLNS